MFQRKNCTGTAPLCPKHPGAKSGLRYFSADFSALRVSALSFSFFSFFSSFAADVPARSRMSRD